MIDWFLNESALVSVFRQWAPYKLKSFNKGRQYGES